jgi:hypothetical protein
MNTADTSKLPKLLLAGVASATLAIGASAAVSASTDTTEPTDDTTAHTEAGHTMDTTAASLAVDGSAEASSPEAETFCAAAIAVEAALGSEDEAAIGPAVEAITAAAEPVGMAETVGAALAAEPGSPEFGEPYAAIIDYMKANCGFAEVHAIASEYEFEGIPAEIPAGPAIISLENAGEQMHEIAIMRINDDVTLSIEELLALPEEESEGMATQAAFAFAMPGTTGYTTSDLTPGRYVALCFFPEGMTPEVFAQLEEAGVDGPEDTIPAGLDIELGPPHFTKGMVHEFTVV